MMALYYRVVDTTLLLSFKSVYYPFILSVSYTQAKFSFFRHLCFVEAVFIQWFHYSSNA